MEYTGGIGDVSGAARRGVEEGLRDALERILSTSNSQTPRDTGALIESGNTQVSGDRGVVYYDADYAVYVHEDMNDQHPTGRAKFLELAMSSEQGNVGQIVAQAIRRQLGG